MVLDRKFSKLDLPFKQMVPSEYDLKKKKHQEEAFRSLQKLMVYRWEGLLHESEIFSMKKMLLQTLEDLVYPCSRPAIIPEYSLHPLPGLCYRKLKKVLGDPAVVSPFPRTLNRRKESRRGTATQSF